MKAPEVNPKSKLTLAVLIAAIAISLNFAVLLQAAPETLRIDSGCCSSEQLLAKDFSAFYFAEWSLLHNTSSIYAVGSSVNASFLGISPHPETFKYLPSFLLLASPIILLSYDRGLDAFDAFQFALLAVIAFVIINLLQKRSIAVTGIVLVLALLLPFSAMGSWSLSEAYYWQWGEGQSKVLQLALIVISLYFGAKKRPVLSGVLYALSFFDPELAVIAVPLFLAVNRGQLKSAAVVTIFVLILTNVPFLVLPGVASSFVHIVVTRGISTPARPYTLIPVVSIIALSAAMWKEIEAAFVGLVKRNYPTQGRLPL